MCFQTAEKQVFFDSELVCGCDVNIHYMCLRDWFRLTGGREICPSCGKRWEIKIDDCLEDPRCHVWLFRFAFFVISVFCAGLVIMYAIEIYSK